MGGWRTWCAVALVLSTITSCTLVGGSDGTERPPSPSIDPEAEFLDRVDDLCEPFGKADRKVTASKGRSQAARAIDRATDAQEDFLKEARKLEAPEELATPFGRYLKLLKEATSLRHRVLIESKNLSQAVKEDLELAQTENQLGELAREITLSSACPPIEEQFVEFRLFTAKTNNACFELYKKVKKSDVFDQSLATRSSARSGLVALLDFQERVIEVVRKQRKGITDPLIGRLLKVLEDRADVIRELIADFDAFDVSAYEADYQRFQDLWKNIRKMTDKLNLEGCLIVVPRS